MYYFIKYDYRILLIITIINHLPMIEYHHCHLILTSLNLILQIQLFSFSKIKCF